MVFSPESDPTLDSGNPVRQKLGCIFLIEAFALYSVGKTFQHHRPIGQVGNQDVRDPVVEFDQISLRVPLGRQNTLPRLDRKW